uniref:glycosyltransferase family 2 protein n=1 Tax=Gelidibacter sp. TaxID=2018083 RepID=UPI004049963E
MPKVSIIIPNYNHQDYLVQRIESVLNQTYKDFELILLDDASTDESKKILERYSDHIKVSQLIYNNNNSGSVFKQWTKGIELAKGDYIWIAESDDYADSRFLEETICRLDRNASLGMVFTDTQKVDGEGNNLRLVSQSKKILRDLIGDCGIINKTNVTMYLLKHMVIVNASSVVFKKEALVHLDFETLQKFKNTGDVFVYMGIALKYDILFLNKPLNCMRLHSFSTTKSNKNNGQIYKDKLFMLDYYLADFQYLKIEKENVVSFFKANLLFFIDHADLKQIQNILKKMVAFGFVSKESQIKMIALLFFYKKFTYNGKPYAIRSLFKNFLKVI